MPQRRSNRSYSEVPLTVTRRVTESGKKLLREACVHFVGEEPLHGAMGYARRVVSDSGIAQQLVRVVSEATVLSSLANDRIRDQVFGIFVLEHLSGRVYEELLKRSKENRKCRLVQPVTILQSARDQELKIPFHEAPLISLAMHGFKGVTLAGDLEPDERRDLARMILFMGCKAMSVVSSRSTSVVVSRSMLDSRCIQARAMDPPVPVVHPDWVRKCYTESENNRIVQGKAIYRKYHLPPFAGMTLSPAQVSPSLLASVPLLVTRASPADLA